MNFEIKLSYGMGVTSQGHSYRGDFLEIALQNLTKIPDVPDVLR